MQGTELAGVELISAIFHYQYPRGKGKKKKDQANGNQTKQNPPIVCLESQLKKRNTVSVISFVLFCPLDLPKSAQKKKGKKKSIAIYIYIYI